MFCEMHVVLVRFPSYFFPSGFWRIIGNKDCEKREFCLKMVLLTLQDWLLSLHSYVLKALLCVKHMVLAHSFFQAVRRHCLVLPRRAFAPCLTWFHWFRVVIYQHSRISRFFVLLPELNCSLTRSGQFWLNFFPLFKSKSFRLQRTASDKNKHAGSRLEWLIPELIFLKCWFYLRDCVPS